MSSPRRIPSPPRGCVSTSASPAFRSRSSGSRGRGRPGETGPAAGLAARRIGGLLLLPRFASFLSFVEEFAPPPLARAAAELSDQGGCAGRWCSTNSGGGDEALAATEALIAWTFLQPYAEHLADHTERLEIHATPPLCPLCSGRPQVGVLRPQGDGGKRSLICSLCATEWDFRRIVCPACGEEDVDKLPVYIAEELGHVRVEACDTCRHYIKTIDLTKDGRAVPVVDELAAIPLSLWAAENRYTKLSPNPLGL